MTNEKQGGSLLKQLLTIFLIGIYLYCGGRGWACLFTSNRAERARIGWLAVWLFLAQVVLFLVAVIASPDTSYAAAKDDISFVLLKLLFFYLLFLLPGCLFLLIAWLTGRDSFTD